MYLCIPSFFIPSAISSQVATLDILNLSSLTSINYINNLNINNIITSGTTGYEVVPVQRVRGRAVPVPRTRVRPGTSSYPGTTSCLVVLLFSKIVVLVPCSCLVKFNFGRARAWHDQARPGTGTVPHDLVPFCGPLTRIGGESL